MEGRAMVEIEPLGPEQKSLVWSIYKNANQEGVETAKTLPKFMR